MKVYSSNGWLFYDSFSIFFFFFFGLIVFVNSLFLSEEAIYIRSKPVVIGDPPTFL